MEGLTIPILKFFLFTFGSLGIIFHLLALGSPEDSKKMEQSLSSEFGSKKRFAPWLENNRMQLHGRLMRSKIYNICAVAFLIVMFILLFQV